MVVFVVGSGVVAVRDGNSFFGVRDDDWVFVIRDDDALNSLSGMAVSWQWF